MRDFGILTRCKSSRKYLPGKRHTQSLHTEGRVNARFFAASVIMALNVPSRVPESGVREGSRGVCPLLGGTTILVLRNISYSDNSR